MQTSAYWISALLQDQDKYFRSFRLTPLIYKGGSWSLENMNNWLKMCWFILLADTW